MSMRDLHEVYARSSWREDSDAFDDSDYQPLLESMGYPIILQKDEHAYQGDSFLLLQNPETHQYGYLTFGWGSCSGCDALQACSTFQEATELRDSLVNDIVWHSHADMLAYLKQHDWEGEWSGYSDTAKTFREEAITYLESVND